jgi:peptidoglycan/LPS O-acetylase OafA/YrhL
MGAGYTSALGRNFALVVNMKLEQNRLPSIDAIKVVASQLIIWHHLAFYGPMSDVVYPHAPLLIDWLYDNARIAVQAFLVIGGFLAARTLVPSLGEAWTDIGRLNMFSLIWRRYVRLVRPYLAALLIAMLAAALARQLIQHPATPQAPSHQQLVAHIFMLQDVVDVEALSAGVWYVAIDFQLYALLVLLLWFARKLAGFTGMQASRLVLVMCLGLTGASLLWLNRNPGLDEWAPYFFGAYGLGILAQWASQQPYKGRWVVLLAVLVLAALALEWRSRTLVAGITALLLVLSAGNTLVSSWLDIKPVAALGRISYSVFLIHYPVCLVVGALIYRLWPSSVAINLFGMFAAWLLSLAAGFILYRTVENPGFSRLRNLQSATP